ncbi:MAG TPA: hypothetical protein VN613_04595 [Gemmatimonadaceae bacterium]|nr:hypothetical protein [Gemmatimonadaceae bacterium]
MKVILPPSAADAKAKEKEPRRGPPTLRAQLILVVVLSLFPVVYALLRVPGALVNLLPASVTTLPARLVGNSPLWSGVLFAAMVCFGSIWMPFADARSKKSWIGFVLVISAAILSTAALEHHEGKVFTLTVLTECGCIVVGRILWWFRPLWRPPWWERD